MKPISSVTIGALSQAAKEQNLTGEQLGATGSEMEPIASFVAEMPRAMVARDPEQNTKGLVSQLRSYGLEVSWKTRLVFPTDTVTGASTWKDEVIGAKLSRLVAEPNSQEAKKAVEEALAPAMDEHVSKWLTALSLAMRHQVKTQDDFDLMSRIYVRGCREFPGDIVRDTITSWRGSWFPTWTELLERLEDRSRARRALMRKMKEMHP